MIEVNLVLFIFICVFAVIGALFSLLLLFGLAIALFEREEKIYD